jgi:membrane associated rhomboid family serine protease
MNDARFPPREPVSSGPGILVVLVAFTVAAHFLRRFAAPLPDGELPAGALSMDALVQGEWWSVLTYVFTHQDVWHLASNMLLLVLAGRAVQRNAGAQHFAYIFLCSAWAGAALSLCLRPGTAIIGASGAVWGIIGAFVALHPEYDLMRAVRRFVPLQLKAKRLFPAFLTVHVALEIAVRFAPQGAEWMDIGRSAHLVHAGGLLAGWLYGRRLAVGGRLRGEWNDFFPQGLRRRFRDEEAGRQPVAARATPQRGGEPGVLALPAPSREMSDSEFLRERVDPVLEKLYASGADKLTAEERAVLEEASRRFSRGRSS